MFVKKITVLLLITINNLLFSQATCPSFSSYFGGNQFDEIKSVCVDKTKNNYIIGNSYSTNLVISPGLINDTASGDYDVFLAKFDSCGTLIWSTYFGGIGFESAEKMEIASDGNIVFCGYTTSLSTPTTTGCFQSINNGGYDCFITKITPNGSVVWSTFFGKSGGDFAFDLKMDTVGNIIIGGTSTSTNLYTNSFSFQPNHKGSTDAFIARFSKDGLLKWCTYYGGNASEDVHALAVDLNCNVIGVGETFSNNLNTSLGAFQSINEGASDTYIIKLDSNGTRVFSSYLGGSGSDDPWGLVCDSLNNIYVAGHTNSMNFDTTALAYQTLKNGGVDCYLTKWSSTGTLLISTLFGGSLNDNSCRLVSVSGSEILLLTETESTNLPIYTFSQQTSLMGSYDIYLSAFDINNLFPTWGTYYGGSTAEDASDISVINTSEVVFCGSSNSNNYPVSSGAHQLLLNNSTDGVVTKINITKNVSTQIQDHITESVIEFFPNPCNDYLIVKSKLPIEIEIKSLLGQTICHSDNSTPINTKYFAPGVYIITANSKSYRFIKL